MATEKEDVEEQEEPEEKPAKKEPPKVTPDDEGGVTVEGAETPRKTRRERRAEGREDHTRRIEQDNATIRRQLNELQQALATRALQGDQRQANGDPYADEINHIRSEQENIQSALRMGAIQSDADVEKVRKRYYELSEREKRIDRERLKREIAHEMKANQPEGAHEEAVIRAEYPDVIASPAAIEFAKGEYYRLVAKGQPRTLATTKKAMETAIEEFGLRPGAMPASASHQQRRYGLPPSQAGTKNNGTGGVRLNAQQQKMAFARWPEAEENEALANMARLVAGIQPEAE
jgi:hypothetical protein